METEDLSLHPEEKSPRGVALVFGSLMFGFVVWAIHFVFIYGFAAVACSHLSALNESAFLSKAILAGSTVLGVAIVAWHGIRHYRMANEAGEGEGFVSYLNALLDLAAGLGIFWQFIPIFAVPLCR